MSRCQNEQYSKRKYLEISGIPARMGDKDIEKKVLEIVDAIEAPVHTDLYEECQGKPSKASTKEVILKLSCRKVSCRYC